MEDKETQFSCLVSGNKIYGLVNVPTRFESNNTMIIFIPDWSGNRQGPHRMFVKFARLFEINSIGSVRFDFRGRGESMGKTRATSYQTMVEDIATIHHMVLKEYNPDHVFLFGYCTGALLSLSYSLCYLGINGSILLSPASNSSNDNILDVIPEKHREIKFDKNLFEQNLLIIYGGNDPDRKTSHMYYSKLLKHLKYPHLFKIIQEANHGFFSLKWEKMLYNQINTWLKENSNSNIKQ